MATRSASERPNIRQVAEIAGVSHMTVSRVLNGHTNIKESTREKVLVAVDELGYRPNIAARALATQKTLRIGAIVETETEFGPASALRAIHRAARQRGYSVSSIALDEDDSTDAGRAFEQLAGLGIDALCLVTPRSASLAALRAISPDMPVLVVKPEREAELLRVCVDQQLGVTMAVDHLAALGHRDILHVSGPMDWLDARARERAFRARTRSWGMPERPIVAGDWSADFGYDFAVGLQRLPDYTAIFAANDQVALGIVHGLHDRGIRVPEDLSIVGFDDAPFSRHSIPPLTTVRQPFDALGVAVVEVLLAAIQGQPIPQRTKIPPELVVRLSTAKVRQGP
ncbi:LacI family DNA-binding transcriptional regulator [Brachybacterium sp. Z12]|uniref:LacI family DNA-binding transcriptional regulator n=1 Tax=Brachybacterium sp. Z12 TaxID=2759167 RepID=UPI0018611C5E|nr:LacI family DNA-binding transcriptional regulator [Brachybacterium sp. Z12]QNN82577.1 LacI family DNA-binding transcriptional regulator [Brachybacterium sp. Z12]